MAEVQRQNATLIQPGDTGLIMYTKRHSQPGDTVDVRTLNATLNQVTWPMNVNTQKATLNRVTW